jgi:hypothetical protein
MQTLLQLNPPIPMQTPRGEGLAVLVIDYGPDHDLWWTVILSKGEHAGEIWTYSNPQLRGVGNITLGRPASLPPREARSEVREGLNSPEPASVPHPGQKLPGSRTNGRFAE